MRLFASNPPDWWPYWVIKLSGRYAPPKSVVLVDNGAFGFYMRGSFPPLSAWVRKLRERVVEQRRRGTREVYVVLPDYPMEPAKTLLTAKQASRALCTIADCVVVMHYTAYESTLELRSFFETYMTDIEAKLYAVPLKLPTTKYYSNRGRRAVTDTMVQLRVIAEAHEAARMYGVKLHLMAPSLTIVKRIRALYTIESFDTTEWTRAITSEIKKRIGTISARNKDERDLYFTEFLDYISKYIPLEGWAQNTI